MTSYQDDHHLPPSTLARFLSGECSPAESAEVMRWAQSRPERLSQLERLRAAWESAARPPKADPGPWSSHELWGAIVGRLEEAQPVPLHVVRASSRPFARAISGWRRHWLSGTAAVVAGLLLFI